MENIEFFLNFDFLCNNLDDSSESPRSNNDYTKCQSCGCKTYFSNLTLLTPRHRICKFCFTETAKMIRYIESIEVSYILRDPKIHITNSKNKIRKIKIKKDRRKIF